MTNSYCFNNAIGGKTLQQVGDATATPLICDGNHTLVSGGGAFTYRDASFTANYVNVAYSPADIAYRHTSGTSGAAIAAYVDSHVELDTTVSMGNFLTVTSGLVGEFCAGNPAGSGGFTTDMDGTGNTLTAYNTPGISAPTGSFNNSGYPYVSFPGTGGYKVNGTTYVFTAFVVFQPTGTPLGGGNENGGALVDYGQSMNWNDLGLEWATTGNGNLSGAQCPAAAIWYGGNGYQASNISSCPLNSCHMVGMTLSNSAAATTTYNGIYVFDHTTSTISGMTGHGNTGGNACIGSGGNTNQTMYFIGNIADVIIYNQVLTASQVSSVQAYLTAKYGI